MKNNEVKIITVNKKAYHDYHILEVVEAGIVLKGCEVKSIRNNKINLKGSFCKIIKGNMFLFGTHISKYESINSWERNIEETRDRILLLHKKQITKLKSKVEVEGMSLIPLKVYFNERNICKLELALCKGKKDYDKREDLKKKSQDMDMKRELSNSH